MLSSEMLLLLIYAAFLITSDAFTSKQHYTAFALRPMSSLNQRSYEKYDTNQASGKQINFLLEKALQLARSFYKPNNSSTANILVPAKLSFSTSHSENIILPDALAAIEYLSLPASEYSVLNSGMVSRSQESDDAFILHLPLGAITQATRSSVDAVQSYRKVQGLSPLEHSDSESDDFIGNKGNKAGSTTNNDGLSIPSHPKKMEAQTTVTVSPLPLEGRVIMESGDIVFVQEGNTLGTSSDSAALKELLPAWLVWGNSGQNKGEDDDVNREESDTDNQEKQNTVRSAIQGGVRIELLWDPNSKSTLDLGSQVKKSKTAFLSFKRFKAEEDGITQTQTIQDPLARSQEINESEYSISLKAKVHVWINLSLPLQQEISNAINFPPIRLLIQQAGRLTAYSVVKTIAPSLAQLLVADYNSRKVTSAALKLKEKAAQEAQEKV